MRRRISWPGLAIGCGVALAAIPPAGRAAEQVVTAQLEWRSERLAGGKANEVRVKPGTPDGLEAPADDGELKYGRILGRIWCCVDYSPKARLWVDLDMDGALNDETVIKIQPEGTHWSLERTINVPVPGRAEPFPLDVRLYQTATCSATHVHVVPQAHRAGTVILAGRLRQVVLTDGNADLRFDDPTLDRLFVDLNGDGKLDAKPGSPDHVEPNTPFRLAGQTWEASIPDGSGSAVEFRPSDQTPPAAGATWSGYALSAPGRRASPPSQSLAQLIQRFERERRKPAVQRRSTLARIGRLGTAEAFAFLEQVARGDDPPVVQAGAISGMGYVQHVARAAKVTALYNRSGHYSPAVAVLEALHYMNAPDREALYVKELKAASHTSIVRAAAQYLTAVPTDTARAAVLEAARNRQPATARYAAYQGARYLQGGPPRDLVEAAAADSYASLAAQGLRDLVCFDPDKARAIARKAAAGTTAPVYVLALAVCDVLGGNATPADVKILLQLSTNPNSRIRERVRELLLPLRGDATVKVLLGGLKDASPIVRALVATVLAKIPERRTTDALLKAARSEGDADALAAICDALGDHGDPKAVDLLLRIGRSRDAARRSAAIRALARIGPGIPKVARFLLKLLSSKNWHDRIYALDAAAANPSAAVADKVIANLRHDQWQVRVAAAQALGQIRVKKAIEPLIDRLEKEKHQAVTGAIAEALFLLTGQNFYDIAKIWRQWWEANGRTFKVPEQIPEHPTHKAGGSNASFYGITVSSKRLIFVIDQSGSMGATDSSSESDQNRLEVAVAEVLGALGKLNHKAWINVILFESRIHPWQPQLRQLTPKNRELLKQHLLDQRPMGGTNLYDGLEMALNAEAVDTIFLLSDGSPGAGKFTAPSDILREVRKINQVRRITIHCVSIGMDSQLMKDLAAQNGGRYVHR